jgi:hypothetical protein
MKKLLAFALLLCALPLCAQITADSGPDEKGQAADAARKKAAKEDMLKRLDTLEKNPKTDTPFLFCGLKRGSILVLGQKPDENLQKKIQSQAGDNKCKLLSGLVYYDDSDGEWYLEVAKVPKGAWGRAVSKTIKRVTGRELNMSVTDDTDRGGS